MAKAAKKAPKKKAAGSAKQKVNKSQAIRDYNAKHPNDGPTAVTKALAAQGIKVTPPQVSNVLSAAGKKTKGKKRGPKPGSKRGAASSTDKVSLDSLIDAQKFAEKVGGVDEAKQLIGALQKLQS